MLKYTHLRTLVFFSFLTGCFITVFMFMGVSWTEIEKELEGNFVSGMWYIVPITLAVLMTIVLIYGTILSFLALKKEL